MGPPSPLDSISKKVEKDALLRTEGLYPRPQAEGLLTPGFVSGLCPNYPAQFHLHVEKSLSQLAYPTRLKINHFGTSRPQYAPGFQ